MAKAKGKKRKARKQQTIDLKLRVSVELDQGRKQNQPRKETVKRITSRKRQNLREMRRGMMTQAQAQAQATGKTQQSLFANPTFYGNVKMLNDSALNQFQNCSGRPHAYID